MQRIPGQHRTEVLGQPLEVPVTLEEDAHCLASLKHLRSLMPFAQEADGAIGGHVNAVWDCYSPFRSLAQAISERVGLGELAAPK